MSSRKEMRRVYSDFLREEGQKNPHIVALEADLSSSMATDSLADVLGKRYINVGIMEQEMVGVAAGLSLLGFRPYLHTFGPFATRRVFDQLFISLAYANLGATIIGSDAGVSAEMNGGTHMPFEDIGLMRLIPRSTVFEVSDDLQFASILKQTLHLSGLTYIRTIRKQAVALYDGNEDFSQGYIQLKAGSDLTLLASGIMVAKALEAARELEREGYQVAVVDVFRLKPLNPELRQLVQGRPVITVENHNRIGGLGSSTCELLAEDSNSPVYRLGVDEAFGQVGTMDYLLTQYGLTVEDIVVKVKAVLTPAL